MENSSMEIYHDILECMVGALEAKDQYTCGHSNRVADMSYDLAKTIGINGTELEMIHIAAHLHDIGKIGISDNILNKSDKLTADEWEHIKKHPEIGHNILVRSKKLEYIAHIILFHHERWDGNGYGAGLKGEDIPLGSRIIGICDAIDAMTSNRAYRKAMPWTLCREEVKRNKGLQFDPRLVDALDFLWQPWESQNR